MGKTTFLSLVVGLSLAAHCAQGQNWVGFHDPSHSVALLRMLAIEGCRHNQPFVTQSSCHLTRGGYESGNAYGDSQTPNELTQAQVFWEKRRLRQRYLDEERQQRMLTQQDVEVLREHRDSLRQVMELKGELAADRARRQSPGRPDFQELHPASGRIYWPTTLQDDRFAAARSRIDTIFAQRSGYNDRASDSITEIPQLTQAMTATLKTMIRELPSGDYVVAKTFLKKLQYESRFAPLAGELAAQ